MSRYISRSTGNLKVAGKSTNEYVLMMITQQCKCGYFFLDFGFLLLIGLATKSSSSLNLVIEKKIWRRRRLLRRQNSLKLSSRHHRDLLVVAFQPVVLRNRRARIARVPRTVQTAVGHPSVEPRRVLRRPAVHLSVVGRVVL